MKTGCLVMKFLVIAALMSAPVCSAEDVDDFDGLFPDEADASGVNEGELAFLSVAPDGRVHTHMTRITLMPGSLADGWARLEQCHLNLDSVASAQVLYRDGRIRRLAVASATGIGQARVKGPSVQLEDVTDAASLCVTAESRVVQALPGDGFVVRNGPFMRRFLDGYYPMHVTLEIRLPEGDWRLERSRPTPQAGFTVTQLQGGIVADAWFEGRLETEFYFTPADSR